MTSQLIHSVELLRCSVSKLGGAAALAVEAIGITNSGGWTSPVLVFVDDPDCEPGIYTMEFKAVPPEGDVIQIVTPIKVNQSFDEIPENLAGIRVIAENNYMEKRIIVSDWERDAWEGKHQWNKPKKKRKKDPPKKMRRHDDDGQAHKHNHEHENLRKPKWDTWSKVEEESNAKIVNVMLYQIENSTHLINRDQGLINNEFHSIHMNIGQFIGDSVISDIEVFPETALMDSDIGHWLEVFFISSDLQQLPNRPMPLFLPRQGDSWVCGCDKDEEHTCKLTERDPFLKVAFKTPIKTGVAKMTLAIYYNNNLLQAIHFEMDIIDDSSKKGRISSEYDYQLSIDFSSLGELEPKSLALYMSKVGDRYFIIKKSNDIIKVDTDLTEGQVNSAADLVRSNLREIYFKEHKSGRKERFFDNQNRKNRKDFIADLKRLAWWGQKLWESAIGGREEYYELKPSSRIQVGRSNKLDIIFPWAFIYDIPLIITTEDPLKSDRFHICPLLEDWDTHSTSLGLSEDECPFESEHQEMNTLCPYGFWGFRYIIEQPPSTKKEKITTIRTYEMPPEIVIGYTNRTNIKLRDQHFANLRPYSGFEDVMELFAELRSRPIEILYFYAHGRREILPGGDDSKKFLPILEIGDHSIIRTNNIASWPRLNLTKYWDESPPLVLINGCHTAELTSNLLANLVTAFADIGAVGVVGTEISVDQIFANEAAEVFLQQLFEERPLGDSIHRMRIHFLKKGNVLGLAYTPYCLASVRISKKTEYW